VTVRRRTLLAAAALALPPAHPLHTTHTDLVERDGTIAVTVRSFTDDLANAVRQDRPDLVPDDSALARYVRARLVLSDPEGRPLPLRWLGRRTQGDLTLLELACRAPRLAGVRVTNRLHFERFLDQVNIVQARYGGRTATLLFTPGTGPKVLP
jgi:hypothetical protein